MAAHPLDNPVWHALGGPHSALALPERMGLRRYVPEIAIFAAVQDPASIDPSQVAHVLAPGEAAGFAGTHPWPPADAGLEVVLEGTGLQMVAEAFRPAARDFPFVVLGADNVAEMLDLVALTQPGPFGPRTHEMGRYVGIVEGDRLVAMAGERLRLPGYTEVSAVCTHPDCRGRGYAAALVTEIARGIFARGETPFLHVYATNSVAIAAYEKLGFATRKQMNFIAWRRPA